MTANANSRQIIKKIRQLEKAARIERDARAWKTSAVQVVDHLAAYMANVDGYPAFAEAGRPPTAPLDDLEDLDRPQNMAAMLEQLASRCLKRGSNHKSSRNFSYFVSGGLPEAALGVFWGAATNIFSGRYQSGPGSVALEGAVVRWAARVLGYPPSSQGNLTSGGSLANLSAIVVARDAMNVGAAAVCNSVVYVASTAHFSIKRALHIAGLATAVVRTVAVDQRQRMNAKDLADLVRRDKLNGLRPFLAIGTAGTTTFGSVDPLNDIADICEGEALWFHVDAAYGGFFRLCAQGEQALRGIERADSIVANPHKGLFLPHGIGLIVVREGEHLKRSNAIDARGGFSAIRPGVEPSPAELSPEVTRPFRALSVLFVLKLVGVKGVRAALEEKLWLARWLYSELASRKQYEMGPRPDLAVVVFGCATSGAAGDPRREKSDANTALYSRLRERGFLLNMVEIEDVTVLRVSILSYRTHLKAVRELLHAIDTEHWALRSVRSSESG